MSSALRERALRLLARRDFACEELSRRLAPYAETADDLRALLSELLAEHLLSDERYAGERVRRRSARWGNGRLAEDLRAKGVSEGVISTTLAAEENEVTRACRVWQRKFAGEQALAGDAATRARQARFLANRGFSGETIRRVLRGDLEDD